MTKRLVRATLFILCLLGISVVTQAQSDAALWSSLDSFITDAMKQYKVPGLAIGVVQGDRAVYVKGFGVRDINTQQAVTPETLFDIGSCTKAFTAASAAILADEGKMHWDDRVDEYIPFFHLYDPLADENVTMRDLLTHRTGMGGTDLLWYGSTFSLPEIIQRVRYIPPTAGFRSVFQYQNVMYATAGYAVGEASGGTWQDFVREHIFEPLGMRGADFSAVDAQRAADHATPHMKRPDGNVAVIPWRNIDNVAPAGSINAGVGDMTKWIAMQLNDGMANGKRLISEESMKEMRTPHIVVPQGGEFDLFFPQSMQLTYGMGWFIGDYHGHQLVMHPGDIDGFASLVVLIPEIHTGFVILSNLDHNPVRAGLAYHLIDQLLQLPDEDWTVHFAKVAANFASEDEKETEEWEAKRNPNAKATHELAAYAGTYRNQAYGDAIISVNGDHLTLQFHSIQASLTHFQYDTFVANVGDLGGKTPVTFNLDDDGNVAKVSTLGLDFERVTNSGR
jgi:CubicO group peptidase (beta-lactamase class C family)